MPGWRRADGSPRTKETPPDGRPGDQQSKDRLRRPAGRWTTSTSQSTRARSSRSSAPTGPAKTTFFNMLTGLLSPDCGPDRLRGDRHRRLARRSQITRPGLARTFQNVRLFPNLTSWRTSWSGRHGRTSKGLSAGPVLDPGLPQGGEGDRGARQEGPRLLWHAPGRLPLRPARPSCCPMPTAAASRSPGRWPPSPA